MSCYADGYFPVILQLLPMDRAIYGRGFTQRQYPWRKTLNLWGKISKKCLQTIDTRGNGRPSRFAGQGSVLSGFRRAEAVPV